MPEAPLSAAARVSGTQCRAPEAVLYSCRFGRAVGSVCGGRGVLAYRFGALGKPSLEVASTPDWSNVHVGWVGGQGGGHQSHVRFTTGNHHYVVFEGENGALSDRPGRTDSGIYVGRGPQGDEVGYHQCGKGPDPHRDWGDALLDHAPAEVGARGIPVEAENGPFDAWF